MMLDDSRESGALFESILENHPDLILVKREKSKLVWANKAFRDLYGMTNQQLRDQIDSPINEPDYTLQYVKDDEWVWKNGKSMVIDCEPVTRHDGVVLKFRTFKYPIFNEQGKVIFTVGISSDITDSISKTLGVEGQAKMAALGEMAGGIAHEINNPVGVIAAKARQLRQSIENKRELSQEKFLDNIKSIESYSERIAKIVSGLRNFSRDGSEDPFQPVSVAKIFEDTLELCQSRIVSNSVELIPDLKTEHMILCRSIQISQVLLNLINNAFDAVEKSNEKKIWISSTLTDGRVDILVRDSGPGVPEEIATKIMQPFFTTKEVGKGTGIGLSISLGIMKNHNGSLRLDRSVSKSCFRLSFPAYTATKS